MKTDRQLQQDISAQLAWEPSVHAARIGVEVKDGVVTLAGQVDTYGEKWNAERAAQRVSGVRALTSELKVKVGGPGHRSDADIASSVEHVLAWNASVPAGAIQVMVENGWVTLRGSVDWHYQKQMAIDSLRHLLGVVGVHDHIELKPAVSATLVKTDIEAALRRMATSEAAAIRVGVDGADVTLTGTVHSWAERDAATASAWASPGVRNVVDRMTLGR